MNKILCCGALAAALVSLPAPASARDISLTIADGRVTLIAENATISQILAEWARVGQTQIVNGEKMISGPVTLELRDVPEGKALEALLRSAAGYVVAPRLTERVGGSQYERILILATSRAPIVSASAPPAFRPPPRPIPQQMMPQVEENETEPANVLPEPNSAPFPGPMNQPAVQPGQQPMPQGQQPQGPLTAPRPGPLPQPAAVPGGNPYQPQPGLPVAAPPARRPGGGGGGGTQ
ncbi:MAG TPA: hypothetical protein VJ820_21040 [Propionibacteriaceae bacterium]|nr:hypothetical protein [Propionibacteriaceae bacterium]